MYLSMPLYNVGIIGDNKVKTMKFSELNLNEKILKALDEAGYIECMPVQEMTYVPAFEGKDVFVQSQTGSGKTAAFMISIFYRLLNDEKMKDSTALIVAPTRELADQIGKEASLLGKYLDFKIGVFYGGVGYAPQEKMLADGVDIIIGTPGRMLDFSDSGKLKMKNVGIFVIDEADRLFDMGFYPDLKKMLKKMPGRLRTPDHALQRDPRRQGEAHRRKRHERTGRDHAQPGPDNRR